MEQAYRQGVERTADLVDQAVRLLAALDEAGIPAVPLKGVDAVFEDLYGDPGARTMGDIDVLVPTASAASASAVLHALGYREALGVPADHHHLVPLALPGRAGVVELHTGLHDRRSPATLDASAVLARAVPSGDRPGLRMDRTDAADAPDRPRTAPSVGTASGDPRSPRAAPDRARASAGPGGGLGRGQGPVRAGRAGRHELDAHLTVAGELFGTPVPVALGRAGRRARRGRAGHRRPPGPRAVRPALAPPRRPAPGSPGAPLRHDAAGPRGLARPAPATSSRPDAT